jgi:tetratricopeptide (TPR) repeat protein
LRGRLTSPAGAVGLDPTRWLFLLLLAGLALLGLERFWAGRNLPVPESPTPRLVVTGAADNYAEALAGLNLHRDSAVQRAEALNDGWLIHDIAARAWLFRARLTGSYDDFAAAEAAFRRGEAMADPGTGPHMTGAILSFGMHRLGEAERYLGAIERYAVPPDAGDRAEQRAMRGDIAFYRGNYARALTLYDEADRIAPGTADFRRAIFLSKTGRVDDAERYFALSERRLASPTRQVRSFHELQRGILDLERGRLDEAMAHFRRADAIFPGYWLIEEHVAETLALQGRPAEAERLYRDVIRKTGHPEFMDALAGLLSEAGRAAEARQLTQRAWDAWQRRLKLFPEAAYGHAIDHCVDKGDWACALDLARRNHAARPYGGAKTALARALLGNGRAEEARQAIEPVLASPWRTADLHRTAADIYAALGRTADAATQDRLAKSINPLS